MDTDTVQHVCRACGAAVARKPGARGPSPKLYCSTKCALAWHNAERKRAVELLRAQEGRTA